MSKKKSTKRKSRNLVLGYLENVSSKLFSDYSKELTQLIGKKHGVYALYKGPRLYYVGLATNLRNRIKIHLRDKHAGKWDKFSLYLVRKADHIKELESIILRISDPSGNATRGRLRHAENLKRKLERDIKEAQIQQIQKLLGKKSRNVKNIKKYVSSGKTAKLAPYVNERFIIKATYKGKTYKARVRSNGVINYKGNLYTSPSLAGRAVIKTRTPNGWNFWYYKDNKGEWVKLTNLR